MLTSQLFSIPRSAETSFRNLYRRYLFEGFLQYGLILLLIFGACIPLFPAKTFAEQTRQYSWNMDDDPGWSAEGLWAWGSPTGDGGHYGVGQDPTSGYTGLNVYGYNLYGNYEPNLAETHLTTLPIDCTGLSQVELRFRRWLGVETSAWDHASIRISKNGSDWTEIWQNSSENTTDSSWVSQIFDISAIADGQPTVYVRWTMGQTDDSVQYCGWNIDDVEIWANSCPPCSGTVVELADVTFPANKACECVATVSIEVGANVTFSPGASVTLIAPKVTIPPGFQMKPDSGSSLRIRTPP